MQPSQLNLLSMSYVKVINIAEELGKDCVQVSIFKSTLQDVNEHRLEQLV